MTETQGEDAAKPRQATRRTRRFDPQRRDRIIDACITVISDVGVSGTTHRKVAQVADVSLGAMTYYFSGMEDLLDEAFTRYAERAAEESFRLLAAASNREEALHAIADMIDAGSAEDPGNLVITHELFTLAARIPRFRAINQRWMNRIHDGLRVNFDATTAHLLDTVIEGLTLHQALDDDLRDQHLAFEAVRRMAIP